MLQRCFVAHCECQSHCWRQGGASFASFACGAAFEGLQCDFLLLAYWTHLFALNDEERYNGRHFLHIFSHAVYHVLQTILTTLWLGTRCPIPSLCCATVPRTELSSGARCTVGSTCESAALPMRHRLMAMGMSFAIRVRPATFLPGVGIAAASSPTSTARSCCGLR